MADGNPWNRVIVKILQMFPVTLNKRGTWVGCGKDNQMPVVEAFIRMRALFMTNRIRLDGGFGNRSDAGQSRREDRQ